MDTMSLLSVTVKRASLVGDAVAQNSTYVTLKLENVKSTTVAVKGANPAWEQDFLFETSRMDTGLIIEVWNKGLIWDKVIGYHYLPLYYIQFSNEETEGQWLSLDAELVMEGNEVVGTKNPTGHHILVDCRFELPFDLGDNEALQQKLEMLNTMVEQENGKDASRRMMFSAHSEDSDYTSDISYPVNQHANSSASQYMGVASQLKTPQRSLNSSRENSYERTDESHAGFHSSREQDGDPLSYNSRPPQNYPYQQPEDNSGNNYNSTTWDDTDYGYYDHSPYGDSQGSKQGYDDYSGEPMDDDQRLDLTPVPSQNQFPETSISTIGKEKLGNEMRKPSLERQNSMYDPDHHHSSVDDRKMPDWYDQLRPSATAQLEDPKPAVTEDYYGQSEPMYGESAGYWTADGVYQEVPTMEEDQAFSYYDEGYLENGEYSDGQYAEAASASQVPKYNSSDLFRDASTPQVPVTSAAASTATTPSQQKTTPLSFLSKFNISSGLSKLSQLKSEVTGEKTPLSVPTSTTPFPMGDEVSARGFSDYDYKDPFDEVEYSRQLEEEQRYYEQQRLEEEKKHREEEERRIQKEKEFEEQVERQRREKEVERKRQEEEKERRERELLEKQRQEEQQRRQEELRRKEEEERRLKEEQAKREADKQKSQTTFSAPKLGFNLTGVMSSLTKIASDGISKGKSSLSNLDQTVLGKDSSIKAFGDALLKGATGSQSKTPQPEPTASHQTEDQYMAEGDAYMQEEDPYGYWYEGQYYWYEGYDENSYPADGQYDENYQDYYDAEQHPQSSEQDQMEHHEDQHPDKQQGSQVDRGAKSTSENDAIDVDRDNMYSPSIVSSGSLPEINRETFDYPSDDNEPQQHYFGKQESYEFGDASLEAEQGFYSSPVRRQDTLRRQTTVDSTTGYPQDQKQNSKDQQATTGRGSAFGSVFSNASPKPAEKVKEFFGVAGGLLGNLKQALVSEATSRSSPATSEPKKQQNFDEESRRGAESQYSEDYQDSYYDESRPQSMAQSRQTSFNMDSRQTSINQDHEGPELPMDADIGSDSGPMHERQQSLTSPSSKEDQLDHLPAAPDAVIEDLAVDITKRSKIASEGQEDLEMALDQAQQDKDQIQQLEAAAAASAADHIDGTALGGDKPSGPPKPKLNPRQRWLWAFDKICEQQYVSRFLT